MEKMAINDWDLEEEIETREDVIGVLEAALGENDPEFLFKIIGDIAHSRGMAN